MTAKSFFDDLWKFHRWANAKLLTTCEGLTDEAMDAARPLGPGSLRKTLVHMVGAELIWLERWSMGMGSLRKTLLHLYDAECWWQLNWANQESRFPKSPESTSIVTLQEGWEQTAIRRLRWIDESDGEGLERVVAADFGAGKAHFRVSESMIQLCVHGTLHRAQANNMLRSPGLSALPLDYVVWLREATWH